MSHNNAQAGPVLIVTAGGQNPNTLINALHNHFAGVVVLRERPESKAVFFRRRMRKLGLLTAAGQFATMIVSKFGKRFANKRAAEILRDHGADGRDNPAVPVIPVESINTPAAIAQIRAQAPAVILLVSCRMLKPETLAAMPCPVLNFHAGITPSYRGLMGGYWARIQGDEENFGATVHLVDPGVDTGAVLYQARMRPSRRDTMHTYPLLQTAASVEIVTRAVGDALAGNLRPQPSLGPSRQWYHPPVWTWVWNGVSRGIW